MNVDLPECRVSIVMTYAEVCSHRRGMHKRCELQPADNSSFSDYLS